MTMLLTDSGNLNSIIDELKTPRDDETLEIADQLTVHVSNLVYCLNRGFPFQDVLENEHGVVGIPIALAEMVLTICKYCADHNIDLVEAIHEIH